MAFEANLQQKSQDKTCSIWASA